ncbi:hypothetical protein [Streptomyces hydrogenans]|uniref:hypothetical protein n=1 Tax=Streptomyces hydrogenans TaxID=1873719 RepID=UPI00368527A9
MSSAYDRAALVGPVVLTLAESLALTVDEAVALANDLAHREPVGPTLRPMLEDPEEPGANGLLSDEQLLAAVRHIAATHRPDSYRQMRAQFRTAGHRAGEERLRSAWTRVLGTPSA